MLSGYPVAAACTRRRHRPGRLQPRSGCGQGSGRHRNGRGDRSRRRIWRERRGRNGATAAAEKRCRQYAASSGRIRSASSMSPTASRSPRARPSRSAASCPAPSHSFPKAGESFGSLLSRAEAQGIGFSKLVATGNESDIDVSDLINYLVDDPATKVIALYLEGLRKPMQFRQAALRAAEAGKPIVAFKVGRRSPVSSRRVRIPGRWRDRTSSTMRCSGNSASSERCTSLICWISRSR